MKFLLSPGIKGCASVLIYSLLRQSLILQNVSLLSLCIYFWQERLPAARALKTGSVLIVVRENEEAISHSRLSPCMKNAAMSRLKISAWYNMSHIKQLPVINWHGPHQLLSVCASVSGAGTGEVRWVRTSFGIKLCSSGGTN